MKLTSELSALATYLVFRVMSDVDECSVLGLREYALVARRGFLFTEVVPVVSSSSEGSSGAARFLPLVSLVGSLIVRAEEAGRVARRVLQHRAQKVSFRTTPTTTPTHRLLARASSAVSFPFPLLSRLRFVDDDDAVGCVFCFSFCFAALTRALVRRTLGSESEGSSVCAGDVLLLLVAAWGWVESI